jgi:hypothetical protein
MESKTLHNLSSSYKSFLKNISENSSFKNINEDSTLSDVNKVYDIIDIMLKDEFLQIADINHMINNYEKNNDVINKIKQLSSLRNFLILNMVYKSSKWPLFIEKLMSDLKLDCKTTQKKMLSLFKQYIGTWNTIDKFFIMNDNKTKLSKIVIIDPDDIEFLSSKI